MKVGWSACFPKPALKSSANSTKSWKKCLKSSVS
ncbi:Uncharacterised protein [Vibrio cholerae]|nr:Uncharacterised protein [Vibrio cholerae]